MVRVIRLGMLAGLAAVLAACGPLASPPPPLNPGIDTFAATPNPAPANLGVVFSWTLLGGSFTCRLDVQNDGIIDYTLPNCTSATRQSHVYPLPGSYVARLQVEAATGQQFQETTVVVIIPPNRPPIIHRFEAVPGRTPGSGVYRIETTDPDNDTVECQLDVDNDGTFEYTIPRCNTGGIVLQDHLFEPRPRYTSRLVARDPYSQTSSEITILFPLQPLVTEFSPNKPSTCRNTYGLYLSWQGNPYVTHYILEVTPDIAGYPVELPAGTTSVQLTLPENTGHTPITYQITLTAYSEFQKNVYRTSIDVWGQNTVCNLLDDVNKPPVGSLRQTMANVPSNVPVNFWPQLKGTIPLKGRLEIDRKLTIEGPGPQVIRVSGQGQSSILWVGPEGQATVSRLTFANGQNDFGGAIYVQSDLVLREMVLEDNRASSQGGAIYNEGVLLLEDTLIRRNSAPSGGAIHNVLFASVNRCTLSQNQATVSHGGGIHNSNGLLIVDESSFSNSQASGNGGGIYNTGTMTLQTSSFSNTSAQYGGGVYVDGGGLELFEVNMIGTRAQVDGGGLYSVGGNIDITRSTVSNSQAITGNGGAIYTNASLTLTDSSLRGNQAGSNGGAIYSSYNNVSLYRTTVSSNFATGNGGAFWIQGGTLSFYAGTLLGGLDKGNRANGYGGAVYADSGVSIYLEDTPIISHNQANADNSGGETGGGFSLQNTTIVSGNQSGITNNQPDNTAVR